MKSNSISRGLTASLALSTILTLSVGLTAHADEPVTTTSAVEVSANATTGAYKVSDAMSGWSFGGTVGAPLTKVSTKSDSDKLGAYSETRLDWQGADGPLTGTIRTYGARHAVLWSISTPKALTHGTPEFPAFTALPANLHTMSFEDVAFSPHTFHVASTATPVVLFDDKGQNTAVVSPASDFFVSRMFGDGKTTLSSGLNTLLASVPAGFTHSTLMVFGTGIRTTFNAWGHTYDDLMGRTRPASDADLLLKYFGYWTDNGAFYYYNYDKDKGYAGTMVEIVDHYRDAGIPMRYLQLDSWWYEKTRTDPRGKVGGPKVASLPEGTWNAYGGTLKYRASPDLFPEGLPAFEKKIGVPLVVHGRWIDPASPYHASYKISGVAPVDPKWWDETATYLNASGVITYEQDWLNEIYIHSPEMHSTLEAGPAFADNMARAAQANGETLQYCMATPHYFMNGARYDNLTTIRVSGDRFEHRKWNSFLYTSELANALGIWPWVDTFNSTETGNLLLASLSAGPVGTGDQIGSESKANIMHAVRADGRIVKPDAPIVPSDETVLADARGSHKPAVAWTYSDHAGTRTAYVVSFARGGDSLEEVPVFVPASMGVSTSHAYVYDYFAKTGSVVDGTAPHQAAFGPGVDKLTYSVVAPIGGTGIALLGDLDQFVTTGKLRIPEIKDANGALTATVAIAPTEKSVTLTGYAPAAPHVEATSGGVGPVSYDAATKLFTVTLTPGEHPRSLTLQGDPVFLAVVVLTPGKS